MIPIYSIFGLVRIPIH